MKEQARRILRSPAAPLVIVATFGLGIGGATAGFALAKAVWLHPLPFRDANRLENVWVVNRRYPLLFSGPGKEAARLLGAAPSSEGLTQYVVGTAVWRVGGEPVQAGTALVDKQFFQLLGARVAAGRLPSVSGIAPEAMISTNLADRLGGAQRALGRNIATNGRLYAVVGVAPRGLRFPDFLIPGRPAVTDIWLPRDAADLAMLGQAEGMSGILVRLRRGSGMAKFEQELAIITSRLGAEHRITPPWRLAARSLVDEEVGRARTPALVLFLASLFVLGIAVTNVTVLLLERAWRRRADVGVRLALGGSGRSILWGEVTESLVLAMGGAGLGIGLAFVAMPALRTAEPAGWLPDWLQSVAVARVDGSMVGFALTLAALIALATGALVGRRLLAQDPLALLRGGAEALTGGGPAAAGERHAMLVAEIALSVILAASSLALFRSFAAISGIRTGMRTRNVISVWMFLPAQREAAQLEALFGRILQRLGELPGVRVTAGSAVPVLARETFFEPPAHTALATVEFQHRAVTPGYFRVLGIPLLQGRDFNAADSPRATPVAIVNQTFALAGWKGTSPVGRRIRIDQQGNRLQFLVVGVVGDARDNVLTTPPQPELYTAMFQTPALPSVDFFLRTRSNPLGDWATWRGKISAQIWALTGDVPISSIEPLSAAVSADQAGPRFRATMLASFAAFGLVLAALGVYSVFVYEVARVERGIAVRLALGATRGRVMGGIVWSGTKLSALGIGAGILGGFLALRAMRSLLFGLSSGALAPLLGAALLVGATAVGACAVATQRVFRVDVAQKLRGN